MPLVFKRNAFDDYEAFSRACQIGSIERRTNDKGETDYTWSIGTLPPTPRWQATAIQHRTLKRPCKRSKRVSTTG